jgi:hypothetical protein
MTMARIRTCDVCGKVIPETAEHWVLYKVEPDKDDAMDDMDICGPACVAAWATAQGLLPECQFATKDLGPEPADRAGMRPADLNNPDDVRAITQTVPADVWAETVAKMD